MNLLTDAWIPVRLANGEQRDIRPAELGDPSNPPMELAAVRPDFDGALAQFLIGLFQLAAPPSNEQEWDRHLRKPPSPEEIDAALAPLVDAFHLDGDKPFMQDSALDPEELESRSITSLLLDTPGDNALVNNTDLFIKRSDAAVLDPAMAAQALLTLQINASAGGQGLRTSLRGGGPLSVLVWPDRIAGQSGPATLWQKLWCNVLSGEFDSITDTGIVLPWTRPCLTSVGSRTVLDAWPRAPGALEVVALSYFATPRRIRLQWTQDPTQPAPHACGYVTKNLGANYPSQCFEHPLSPYYRDKDGQWLPLHIPHAGFCYRDFGTLCIGSNTDDSKRRIAKVVAAAETSPLRRRALTGTNDVWAFGFSMDKAKVLSWNETRYPSFANLDVKQRKPLGEEATTLIAAGDEAARLFAQAVRKLNGDADLAVRELRAECEALFFDLLRRCANDPEHANRRAGRLAWRTHLFKSAMRGFEQFAERDVDTQSRVSAIKLAAEQHRWLRKKLGAVLDDALELESSNDTPREAA